VCLLLDIMLTIKLSFLSCVWREIAQRLAQQAQDTVAGGEWATVNDKANWPGPGMKA
jgi:hypothetical protein